MSLSVVFQAPSALLTVDLQNRTLRTNMVQSNIKSFSHSFSAPPPFLSISSSAVGGRGQDRSWFGMKRFFSTRSIVHLFLLYLFISLAQQVQRLRTEVAYVAEEARDLRLYGLASSAVTSATSISTSTYITTETTTTTATVGFSATPTDIPIGKDDPTTKRDLGDGSVQRNKVDMGVPRRGQGGDVRTSLGRVVFGRSAWDKWAGHPT